MRGGGGGTEPVGFYAQITFSRFAKLRKVTISFVMSISPLVCTSFHVNSAPTRRIFIKFDT